jgi:thiamine pyrophosphate-dependent acetolactate synthase large subunit-like protein
VYVSLPSDVLDATVPADSVVWPADSDFIAPQLALPDAAADTILALLAAAARPLVIGAPVLATRDLLRRIEATLGIPACLSKGPRGFNYASLGDYADAAAQADMVLLPGKVLDLH